MSRKSRRRTGSRREKKQRQSSQRNHPSLQVESLEDRRLLAINVITDHLEYVPEQPISVIVDGMQMGEVVELQVQHSDGTPNIGPGHEPWTVTDGSLAKDVPEGARYDLDGLVDGRIQTWAFVDESDVIGSTFQITATAISSGDTDTTQFTGIAPANPPQNIAPILSQLTATSVNEGTATVLSGTIIDPDVGDEFKLRIDWGDPGSADNIEFVTVDAGATGSRDFSITHFYPDDRDPELDSFEYQVSVSIIDDNSSWSRLVAKPGDMIEGRAVVSVSDAAINDAGTVVIEVARDNVGLALVIEDQILIKSGDEVDGVTLTSVKRPDINDAGNVAFRGRWHDGTEYVNGIFDLSNQLVKVGDTIDGKTLTEVDYPAINDLDTVVFIGSYTDANGPNKGIFTPTELLVAGGDTIDGVQLTRNGMWDLSINDDNQIAFRGSGPLGDVIFSGPMDDMTGSGSALVKPGDVVGGHTLLGIAYPNLNDRGVLTFRGAYAGGNGFFVDGKLTHEVGIEIDGETVNYFESASVNNHGDIAFLGGFPTEAQPVESGIFVLGAQEPATASTLAKVTNTPPTVVLNPLDAIQEGGVATLSGTVFDAGANDSQTLRVDWGDGNREFFDIARASQISSFTDSVFDESGWDTIAFGIDAGDSYTTAQVQMGGNADEHLRIDLQVADPVPGNVSEGTVVSINRNSVYDPTLQGEIGTIDFDIDVNLFATKIDNRFGLAIRQDGKVYLASGAAVDKESIWESRSFTYDFADATQFVELGIAGSHPDFSSSGSAIEFGFYSSVSIADPQPVNLHAAGFDNWAVSVTPSGGSGSFSLNHVYEDDDPSGTSSDEYQITVSVIDDDMSWTRLVTQKGDVIEGKAVVAIIDAAINDSGSVVVEVARDNVGLALVIEDQILVKSGDYIDGIRLTHVSRPDINESGNVAFRGRWHDGNDYVNGIFDLSNQLIKVGDTIDGKTLTEVDYPAINDLDNVVFIGTYEENGQWMKGIFSSTELLVRGGDVIDGIQVSPYTMYELSINDDNQIAFRGGGPDGDVIFGGPMDDMTGSGQALVKLGDVVDGKTITHVAYPDLNDQGGLSFRGIYSGGTGFFVDGKLTHEVGVEIDGETVNYFESASANNNGDIAFLGVYPTVTKPNESGIFVLGAQPLATASTTVTVTNAPPTVVLDPMDAIQEGGTATLSGTVYDAGVNDSQTLRVDWGDGTREFLDIARASQISSFTDSVFDESGWDTIAFGIDAGDSYTTSQVQSGGNDGEHLRIDLQVADPTPGNVSEGTVVSINTNSVYDPTLQGEIGTIDFDIDVNLLEHKVDNRFGLAIRQDGKVYVANGAAADKESVWESRSFTYDFADATQFVELGIAGSHPDFSANGSAIEFGFYSSISIAIPHPVNLHAAGFDNWAVSVASAGGSGSFVLNHVYEDDNPSGTSSDEYQVTVSAIDDDMSWTRLVTKPGDVIDGRAVVGISDAAINDAGTVVVEVSRDNVGRALIIEDQILVKSGDEVDGVTLTAVYRPDINDAGNVAFRGRWHDGTQYVNGIFDLSNQLVKVGDTIDGKTLTEVDYPAINDLDTVVFIGSYTDANGPNKGIFTPTELLVAGGDTIDGVQLTRNGMWDLSINDDNQIAFRGSGPLGDVIFSGPMDDMTGSGSALVKPGDVVDGHTLLGIAYPNLNDRGVLTFRGAYAGGNGFFVDGKLTHEVGIEIDGETVNYFESASVNNNGDIAFLGVFPTETKPNESGIFVLGSGEPETATTTITVQNAQPIIENLVVNVSNDESGQVSISGTIADPGGNDALDLEIDWGDGYTVTYSYAAGTTSFAETHQYTGLETLSAGETIGRTVTYTLSDDDDSSSVGSTDITLTGLNDRPDIFVGTGDTATATLDETNTALQASGTLSVIDIDQSDSVAASVISVAESGDGVGFVDPATLLGMMSIGNNPVVNSSSTEGTLAWSFDSGNESFDHLAIGNALTLTYTLLVDDGSHGAGDPTTDTQTVSVTINGENDNPIANEDLVSTTEKNLITIDVLSNDSDPDLVGPNSGLPGTLDTDFGQQGMVTTDITIQADQEAHDVLVQPDGKYVVAGTTVGFGTYTDFALVRYNADGSLDSTFGNGGFVSTPINGTNFNFSVTSQTNGKLLVSGTTYSPTGSSEFTILRYDTDGTIDNSFGTAGVVYTEFGSSQDIARAIAVTPDGDILVAGYTQQAGDYDFALARYNGIDGSLDTSFGTNGKIVADVGGSSDFALDVEILSDGSILVAGDTRNLSSGYDDYAILRYDATGSLDTSFGVNGIATGSLGVGGINKVQIAINEAAGALFVGGSYNNRMSVTKLDLSGNIDTSFGTNGSSILPRLNDASNIFRDIDLRNDGKIVMSGYASNSDNTTDFLAIRLTADGSLDTTFDQDGFRTDDIYGGYDFGQGVALDGDQMIVVGFARQGATNENMVLMRLNDNGSLDATFGTNGLITTDIPLSSVDDQARDVALQSSGKSIVVGDAIASSTSSGIKDIAIARYNLDGTLDQSFGNAGIVSTDLGSRQDQANAVAIQHDDKIIVVGKSEANNNSDFTLVRYDADGDIDTSFGIDGIVTTDLGATYGEEALDVALQSDGKIVVTGKSGGNAAVVRYESNGNVDSTFGNAGIVITDFGRSSDSGNAITIDDSGSIIIGGVSGGSDGTSDAYDMAVARYTTAGQLDLTFDSDGFAIADFGAEDTTGFAIAVQQDGKILTGGSKGFALARFNVDGSLDTSFGIDGMSNGLVDGGTIHDLRVLESGQILAAGSQSANPTGDDFVVTLLNADGSLDPQFASDGVAEVDLGNSAHDLGQAVAIQSDGSILVAGYSDQGASGNDFALLRLNGFPVSTLSVESVDTHTTYGLVTDNGDGTITYDPDGRFTSLNVGESYTDSFTYTVIDRDGGTDTAAVSVTIEGINDAPIASPDTAVAHEDGPVVSMDLVANDWDQDFNDPLQIQSVDNTGTLGAVTIQADGKSVSYDPQQAFQSLAEGESTTDTFSYTVVDSHGATHTATATVTINGANDAPVATPDVATTSENVGLSIAVLLNDTDIDANDSPATFSLDTIDSVSVVGLSSGSTLPQEAVTIADDMVVFAPGTEFDELAVDETATVIINYTMSDALGASSSSTLSLTVTGSNDAPVANTDIAGTDERTSIVIDPLSNDIDPDRANTNGGEPGTLDISFGNQGITTTDVAIGSSQAAQDVIVQPDGKYVVAGTSEGFGTFKDFALVRYSADGSLDISFGNGGIVTTPLSGGNASNAVAIQQDGKLVVAGSAYRPSGNLDFAILRYDSDGSLDSSFGTDGIAYIDVGSTTEYARDIAINEAGDIVVAGTTLSSGSGYDFAVARVHGSDGSLDLSFGSGGTVVTNIGQNSDFANSVGVLTDGSILVAGESYNASSGNHEYAVVRYSVDGSIDTSFGVGGVANGSFGDGTVSQVNMAIDENSGSLLIGGVFSEQMVVSKLDLSGDIDTTFGSNGIAFLPQFNNRLNVLLNIELRSDNKIIVSGTANNENDITDFLIGRLNPDGSSDLTFNGNGFHSVDFGDYDFPSGIALDGDKTIAAGFAWHNQRRYDFALARFNDDGTLDSTFGTDGLVTTDIPVSSIDDQARDVALQSSGKSIVIGDTIASLTTNAAKDIVVARYNSDGTLDRSFGDAGLVVTDLGTGGDRANAVAVQPDDKIVVAGKTEGVESDIAIVRYLADGDIDSTFGVNGIVTTDLGATFYEEALDVLVQADGKILVTGTSGGDAVVVRYEADGSLDLTFGDQGIANTDFGRTLDAGNSIAIDENGSIVIGGVRGGSDGTNYEYDIAVARYSVDGILDASFGNDGIAIADFGYLATTAYAVSIQDDGKILAGGSNSFALARFNPDGTLDETFDGDGLFSGISQGTIYDLHVLDDGSIVAAGTKSSSSTGQDFVVALFNTDGTLNAEFASDGLATIDLGFASHDVGRAMVVQGDGSILVAGYSDQGASGNDFTLLRLNGLSGPVLSIESIDTDTTYGLVTDNGDGTITYDPDGRFSSLNAGEIYTDSFTYTVIDRDGGTDTAAVSVTIEGINDAPIASPDTAVAHEDGPVVSMDLVANDWDQDFNDPLQIQSVDNTGTLGTVTIQADGKSVSYDPQQAFQSLAEGESTTDTFSYTVVDSHGATHTATATVTINGANDAPVATPDVANTSENVGLSIDVLQNDTDIDTNDSPATFSLDTIDSVSVVGLSSGPVLPSGAITIVENQLVFTPGSAFDELTANDTATVTVEYSMSDAQGASATSTMTLSVAGANDSPVATPDVANTDEATGIVVDVLQNDTDADHSDSSVNFLLDRIDSVSVVGLSGGSSLPADAVTISDNKLSFDPGTVFNELAINETATVTVDYTMSDTSGATASAALSLSVTGLNERPTLSIADQELAVGEGMIATTSGLFGDLDISDNVSISASLGEISQDAGNSGQWTWTYLTEDDAVEAITITANDGHGGVTSETIILAVSNESPIITSAWLDTDTIVEGDSATLNVEFTDAGVLDQHQLSVLWGDGTSDSYTVRSGSTSFRVSHVFVDNDLPTGKGLPEGTHWVRATLTDDDGAQVSTQHELTVSNDTPSITSSGLVSDALVEGDTATLNISFDDAGIEDFHQATVDWGDGSTEVINVPGGDRTFTATHQYLNEDPSSTNGTDSNIYLIETTVDDGEGTSLVAQNEVWVLNIVPVFTSAVLESETIQEGDTATLNITFSDPGLLDHHLATIDWGDGTSQEIDIQTGERTFSATHQYTNNDPSSSNGTPANVYRIETTLSDVGGPDVVTHNLLTVNNVVPTVALSGPSTAIENQTITFTINAGDISPEDQSEGFAYEVDFGYGTPEQITRQSDNENITVTHVFQSAGAFVVSVTATDIDGGTSLTSQHSVDVSGVDVAGLTDVVLELGEDLDPEPVIEVTLTTETELDQVFTAINNIEQAFDDGEIAPPETPIEVVLDLSGNDFTGQAIEAPNWIEVVIKNGTVNGASPALIVSSGTVIVDNVIFTNSTEASTIVVNGGQLSIRNSVINETDGGDFAAIEVFGGTVDLGTDEDAGGNTILVHGSGDAIRNLSTESITSIGNTTQVDGYTLTTGFEIEDVTQHALELSGVGLVTWQTGEVFVTQDSHSAQRGVDAIADGGTVNIAAGFDDDYDVDAKPMTVAYQDGPTLIAQMNPFDASKMELVVIGTENNDKIDIIQGDVEGSVKVEVNEKQHGTFRVNNQHGPTIDHVIVYGLGGNDDIKIHKSAGEISTELYGGDGDDKLRGGEGHDYISGGAGDDLLSGKKGRDVLVGGAGKDKIDGNDDEDILIGGIFLLSEDRNSVDSIMSEWTREDLDYATRVLNLQTGGGLNGALALNANQVVDDGERDKLKGGNGLDWFFADEDDDKTDAELVEILTQIELDFVNLD